MFNSGASYVAKCLVADGARQRLDLGAEKLQPHVDLGLLEGRGAEELRFEGGEEFGDG